MCVLTFKLFIVCFHERNNCYLYSVVQTIKFKGKPIKYRIVSSVNNNIFYCTRYDKNKF